MAWKQITLGPYVLEERGVKRTAAASLLDGQAALEFLRGFEERNPFWIGDVWNDVKKRFPDTCSQILDDTKWSEATLDSYGWVAKSIPPSKRLFDQGVEFTKHSAVAALVPEERDRILEKAKAEKLTLSAVRQEVRLIKCRKVSEGQATLQGKYRALLVDPDYRTDDIATIAQWAIAAHAQLNAVVFLRHGEAQRFEVAQLLEAWDFAHKTSFIWDRVDHQGPHPYISERHEYLLLAVRGTLTPDRLVPMQDSVQVCKSDGPVPVSALQGVISALFDGPYLMFQGANAMTPWQGKRGLHVA